jgi:RNA polymerase sigma factor (sigma-70 family)
MSHLSTLVSRAANRDERAWAELVSTFGPTLRSIAAGYHLSAEEGADAAQTTWLNLVLHIQRIRDPERIGGWLAITMRHECLRVVQHRARDQVFEEWMAIDPDDGEGLVERLAQQDRDRALWQVVDRLPAHQRTLVRRLSDESEPSYREVATAMAIPLGSVGPTRARALGRLQRMLADEGIGRAALDPAA